MHRTLARCLLPLLAVLLLLPAPPALAKLGHKEWKEVESLYEKIFSEQGNPKGKQEILARIAEDDTGRAWRLMADALFREVGHFDTVREAHAKASAERNALLVKTTKGITAEDENRSKELEALLKTLDVELKVEREAMLAVTKAVSDGPEALRKNILQRAGPGSTWAERAAAVRVAVMTMDEKASRGYVDKTVGNDKDPRVRGAAVDALGAATADGWEGLILGRLADPEWWIVLRAAAVCQERELHRAVPHLINALESARPRVAEGLGAALRGLTGENFEPYADVWGKWWEDHKDDFKSDVALKKGKANEFADVHFYGVPLKSDRLLFIIDISSSMKLKTTNDNPKDRWKPPPVTTGGGKRPPPPPPPEEILSGPKIDVAKHELKKAIKKLPKDYTFNIICFNHGAAYWNKTMQKATDKNKESAYEWIRALKPSGSTFIDGALRLGFEIAGLINFDKRYPDIHLDTIVLLSDGAPTDSSFPVSKLYDTELILEHVREWNKGKQVVIHCIGVDMVEGIEFLKKLAAENGGTYVDR